MARRTKEGARGVCRRKVVHRGREALYPRRELAEVHELLVWRQCARLFARPPRRVAGKHAARERQALGPAVHASDGGPLERPYAPLRVAAAACASKLPRRATLALGRAALVQASSAQQRERAAAPRRCQRGAPNWHPSTDGRRRECRVPSSDEPLVPDTTQKSVVCRL